MVFVSQINIWGFVGKGYICGLLIRYEYYLYYNLECKGIGLHSGKTPRVDTGFFKRGIPVTLKC